VPAELDAEQNLILLCSAHHTEIDRDVDRWPAARLLAAKEAHEAEIRQRIQRVGTLLDVDSYPAELSALVLTSSRSRPLYGSVGEADFAMSWLSRLVEGYQYKFGTLPPIETVVLKRLDQSSIDSLAARRLLDPRFGDRLQGNIDRLHTVLREAGISLELRYWTGGSIPPFHGWLHGDTTMRNSWARGTEGHWHVRTPLRSFSRELAPDMVDLTLAEFQ
jgi:hypothetical protein